MGTWLWILGAGAVAWTVALLVRRTRWICHANDRPVRMELLNDQEEDAFLSAAELRASQGDWSGYKPSDFGRRDDEPDPHNPFGKRRPMKRSRGGSRRKTKTRSRTSPTPRSPTKPPSGGRSGGGGAGSSW